MRSPYIVAHPESVGIAADFEHPVEILTQCHDYIAHHCQALRKLCEYLPVHGADKRARGSAAKAIHYFDTAGGAHYEDEELDLFPRLLQAARGENAEGVALLIARLTREHRDMQALWKILRADLERIARGEGATLSKCIVAEFDDLHRQHMTTEEEQLMPLVSSLLSPTALTCIGQEMAKRRSIVR